MFELAGKGALVTGASGGIGGAIARALHAQGAGVALSGTRTDALDALAAELGAGSHVIPCDLGDAEATIGLIKDAETALGGVDILVNNAGLTRDNLALRMKDEEWQRVLDVNLTASFRLIRACLRGMMKRRAGRVVNITSVVGVTGNPGQANYAASKAGLIGMAKALAQEIASRGITVNNVAPGFIDTAMTGDLTDDQKERLLSTIPGGRLGTPEDVAACVVFLASDEAAYITGQTLHVNGGMAMI
ncbi:MAG: 3-oxoacyl-[acyl-carrier-protein] reductase [Rhodospirillales bacterium]|jgi:3-oxoacyl-[acyl-carrier protein] reductase|nr:3-oxoacyl-[acyl-carrier-protein] reductase [Rhodospirillales bacterium]MDP6774649.1 3-oxoacyl-[acyl-carrier-protein] reductase [Rhodospirillales bacterium]|tara:strand:+ start:289 stop:1026 length:738 start_codon:yes stop_codon:yes gene_type:complete